MCSWQKISLQSLIVVFCTVICSSQALAKPFIFQVGVGVSYLSFSKLSNTLLEIFDNDMHYELDKSNPSFNADLSIKYALSNGHLITLSAGVINSGPTAIIINDKGIQTYMEIPNIKYHICGIPLTLSYEYLFSQNRITPYLNLGVSNFFTTVKEELQYTARSRIKYKTEGNTYGSHFAMGVLANISDLIRMRTQLRYRYSSGMSLESGNGKKVGFSGWSLSVGFAIQL